MWGGEGSADRSSRPAASSSVTDSGAIEAIVEKIVAAHPTEASSFGPGRRRCWVLRRQVDEATQGKANPAQVNQLPAQECSADSRRARSARRCAPPRLVIASSGRAVAIQ